MQQDIQKGCVSFKIVALPEVLTPSIEQVSWAMGRLFRREEVDGLAEPALHSHLLHHFLSVLSESTIPVQVHIRGEPDVERLGAWAVQYPKVRFVGVYGGWGNPFSMMVLARTMPNLAVAVGDLWPVAPQLARQALRIWVQGVPLCKLFACSGNTTLVEALCVHTWLAREQVAALFAEMVAEGVLDEGDAHVAIRHLLYENALSYFDLENQNA